LAQVAERSAKVARALASGDNVARKSVTRGRNCATVANVPGVAGALPGNSAKPAPAIDVAKKARRDTCMGHPPIGSDPCKVARPSAQGEGLAESSSPVDNHAAEVLGA
jgi:hypothetical protein